MGQLYLLMDRWTLAEQLWAFGEDDLYEAALTLSDSQMLDVFRRAACIFSSGDARTGAVALGMAAVALLEGAQRPLNRRRRRPKRDALVFPASREERLDQLSHLQTFI